MKSDRPVISSSVTTPTANTQAQDHAALQRILAETAIFICCVIAVPLIIYIDALFLPNINTENSITEQLHNVMLLVACGVFGIGAFKYPTLRGYLLLATTLFVCMLIRELDALLDKISHGFWVYPAFSVLTIGTFYAYKNRKTILRPMLRHYATRSGTIIYIGLVLLLFFTRFFGTGSLWEAVMGSSYDDSFKGIIQEGTELLSYTLIAFGSCLALLTAFGEKR